MDVLPVFEGSIETGDHGDVVPVLFQGTHRGSELQGIDARVVQVSSLILFLSALNPPTKPAHPRRESSVGGFRSGEYDQFLIGKRSRFVRTMVENEENGSSYRTNEMSLRKS